MPARDIYLLLLRIGSTVLLVFSYFDLFHIVLKLLDLDTSSRVPLETAVAAMVGYLVPGILIIVGARWIARIVDGHSPLVPN